MVRPSAPFGPLVRLLTCPEIPRNSSLTALGKSSSQTNQLQTSASCFRTTNVEQVPSVPEDTSVMAAEALIASSPAASVKPNWQPVNVLSHSFWKIWLDKVVPPGEVNVMLDEVVNGVSIGRPPADAVVVSDNWPSALQLAAQVSEVIRSDLAAGKVLGPFTQPPFQNYIVSPLGAFLKRDGIKIRLIHDLSFPKSSSVNIAISPEDYSLQYSSIDNAIAACNAFEDPYVSNIDLKDAYKAIGVHKNDWHLLGFKWSLPGVGGPYYFSKVLSFGLRSAPALFDKFALALEKVMTLRGVKGHIIRYVDDYLLVCGSRQESADQLAIMVETARMAGFTIQDSKVTQPCKCLEFLGIVIDVKKGVLRISDERLAEVKGILADALGTKRLSKRRLLKIIGKLAFSARVVRTGRAFLGRLIGLAKTVHHLHHHVSLSSAARADLLWWRDCIKSHNGTRLMHVDWSVGTVNHVFTDASDFGCGACWGDNWFALVYAGGSLYPKEQSINWRELHTAVKALVTWAPYLSHAKVIFHIDNQVTCHLLNKLYSPVPPLMELVRAWCLTLETYSIEVAVVYISTADNYLADALSRGDIAQFKARHTGAPAQVWPSSFRYFDQLV